MIYLIVLHTQNHLFHCKDEYDKKRGVVQKTHIIEEWDLHKLLPIPIDTWPSLAPTALFPVPTFFQCQYCYSYIWDGRKMGEKKHIYFVTILVLLDSLQAKPYFWQVIESSAQFSSYASLFLSISPYPDIPIKKNSLCLAFFASFVLLTIKSIYYWIRPVRNQSEFLHWYY